MRASSPASCTAARSAQSAGLGSCTSSGRAEPVGDDALGEQRVLGERELVARREREAPAMVCPDVHRGGMMEGHGPSSCYVRRHRRGHRRVRRHRRRARARARGPRLRPDPGGPPGGPARARSRRSCGSSTGVSRRRRAVRPDRSRRAAARWCAPAAGRRADGRRRVQQRRLRLGRALLAPAAGARAGHRAPQRRGAAPPHGRVAADRWSSAGAGAILNVGSTSRLPAAARAWPPTPPRRRSCSRSPSPCTPSWPARA